jgi:hypothetical protein
VCPFLDGKVSLSFRTIFITRRGNQDRKQGQNRQNRTGRIRHAKQDMQNRTGRKGRSDGADRTGKAEQAEQDWQKKIRLTGKNCLDRDARTGLPG